MTTTRRKFFLGLAAGGAALRPGWIDDPSLQVDEAAELKAVGSQPEWGLAHQKP